MAASRFGRSAARCSSCNISRSDAVRAGLAFSGGYAGGYRPRKTVLRVAVGVYMLFLARVTHEFIKTVAVPYNCTPTANQAKATNGWRAGSSRHMTKLATSDRRHTHGLLSTHVHLRNAVRSSSRLARQAGATAKSDATEFGGEDRASF